jgi:hypothetical protein
MSLEEMLESVPSPPVVAGALNGPSSESSRPKARRRGRPIEMPPETVLERIQQLAAREEGLFRIHLSHGALYSRARRLFGSWQGAVHAAGLDYRDAVGRARERAARARRRTPLRRRPGS